MKLPRASEVFNGRYRVERVLGRGGYAEVYLAKDLQLARHVALKVLLPGSGGYQPEVVKRFSREARVIAGLRSNHTITMFDYGTSADGLFYMVFEYIEGRDLEGLLANEGALPPEVVSHILRQLLEALGEAHSAGVLHRDLKPGNVLVFEYANDPYSVRLIDFGIAKPYVERTTEATHLTADGMVVGTPRYMAPEQFFGEELTPATDLYSLGLLAHEMTLGRRALDEDDPKAVMLRQIGIDSIRLPLGVAPLPLESAINAMTQREQAGRPQSAEAVMTLLNADSDRRMPAPRPQQPQQQVRYTAHTWESAAHTSAMPSGRRWGAWGVVSILVVLAAAGVVGGVISQNADAPPAVAGPRDLPSGLTKTSKAVPVYAPAPDVERDLGDPAPENGCGLEVPERSLRSSDAKVDFTRRSWLTYTPANYDPNTKYPIVFLFHRNSRGARSFMSAADAPRLADANGFIVVAVEGESNPPWESALDLDAVREALARTVAERCVDTSRIYAVGDGAGGRFARELSCAMPLSAVATAFSGQHPGETLCESTPPTPFIRFYGTEDKDIPIKGGPGCMGGRDFLSVGAIDKQWREANSCRGARKTWANHGSQRCVTWTCDSSFVSCGMKGGHEWPTAPPPLFKFPTCASEPADFPLADVMWRFFVEEGRTLAEEAQ